MPRRRVVFTTVALRDLAKCREWLTQPGSGERSKALAIRLTRAAKALSRTAGMYPADRFDGASRQLVVGEYVIRYVILTDGGREYVSVERIHGPGQDRGA